MSDTLLFFPARKKSCNVLMAQRRLIMAVRIRKGIFIVDTRWPDGIRTRRRVEDQKAAVLINKKIVVAVADEARIWKKLRKDLSLRPDQVDTSRNVVTFHTSRSRGTRTKNGKIRQVPLTDKALAAINSVPRHVKTVFYHPDSLEPWRDRTLDCFWNRARRLTAEANPEEASNCMSLRIHDLRHAYAIKLAERGCPMHFISEVLGHHSVEFTRRRYARFSPDSAAQSVLTFLEGRKGAKRAIVA